MSNKREATEEINEEIHDLKQEYIIYEVEVMADLAMTVTTAQISAQTPMMQPSYLSPYDCYFIAVSGNKT